MATVRYAVKVYIPGTKTLLREAPVGGEFDVAVAVRDLRPYGTYTYNGLTRTKVRGVFAAYCNLLFDKTAVKLAGLSSDEPSPQELFDAIVFSPQYSNGKLAYDSPNGLKLTGAFASSFTGLGTSERELYRVRMRSMRAGVHTFKADVFDLPRPLADTLVYGNLAATPPEKSYVAPEDILVYNTSITAV